jgi:hypothetical protein
MYRNVRSVLQLCPETCLCVSQRLQVRRHDIWRLKLPSANESKHAATYLARSRWLIGCHLPRYMPSDSKAVSTLFFCFATVTFPFVQDTSSHGRPKA